MFSVGANVPPIAGEYGGGCKELPLGSLETASTSLSQGKLEEGKASLLTLPYFPWGMVPLGDRGACIAL
jgi:hypothetical protein